VGVEKGRVVELRPDLKPWFQVSFVSQTGASFVFLYDGKNRYAEITPFGGFFVVYMGEQRQLTTADRDLLLKIVEKSLTQVMPCRRRRPSSLDQHMTC
jgi:hypothetical protein